jgi:hypothetical protein
MKEELEKKVAFFEKTVKEFEETIVELVKIKEDYQRDLIRLQMGAKEGDLVEVKIIANKGESKTYLLELDVIRPNGDIGFKLENGLTIYPKFTDLKLIEAC